MNIFGYGIPNLTHMPFQKQNHFMTKQYHILFFLAFVCCSKSEDPISILPEEPSDPIITNPIDPPSTDSPIPVLSFVPVDCINGSAQDYPCQGYNLLGRANLVALQASFANDNWGWTDATTGKEYVLQGLNNGVAFLDISSPTAIRYIGKLPTATDSSTWRDIKVYNDHAFIVSEADDHGLQVFDLTHLRDQTNFQTFAADAHLTDFGSAHNIAINEGSGFAYVIGAQSGPQLVNAGGPMFIDISTPTEPEVVGGYSASGYTHDAQIVNYNGPDTEHQGREIFIGSNSDGKDYHEIVVVDVTDKTTPSLISSTTYGNGGYTHQGWLDEDHRYFYLGDELDEMRYGHSSRTLIFDLQDLDNPQMYHTYQGPTPAIDHNGYVRGNSYYLANYAAGFREIDISGVATQQMQEVGYFDTFIPHDNATFDGVWNVYPFFSSEIMAISDTDLGLFLVQRTD